jgi:site-specific DNA-methyltransferase (cytosine-N4-specific)
LAEDYYRINWPKRKDFILYKYFLHYIKEPYIVPPFDDKGSIDGFRVLSSALIIGDAHKVLTTLPSGFARTVITSPPYWSLRDYGIPGQIGLENDSQAYIDSLVDVFSEVHRVLADDGTLWLNIGDSYTSGGRTWRAPDKKYPARAMSMRPPTPDGLKPKELVGIPWKLAFALQAAGWYLRSDTIWYKPNVQPESVKDRPTRSHEYLFLFSKSERYYYDNEAVREINGRNVRTVWSINTQPFRDAHFATFPPQLVEKCMLLTSQPGEMVLDPFIGSGTVAEVAIQNGRAFTGIELNPAYVKIARKRLLQEVNLERRIEEIDESAI